MQFRAEAIDVADYHAAVELFFERGWTDGLAIVPPTEELVERMVRASGRRPEEEIGEIPPAQGIATVEKLAINSVMAGCRPAYFPIVLAAVEAMLEPEHNLNGVQTTTHSCVPLVIVHGPIATNSALTPVTACSAAASGQRHGRAGDSADPVESGRQYPG